MKIIVNNKIVKTSPKGLDKICKCIYNMQRKCDDRGVTRID